MRSAGYEGQPAFPLLHLLCLYSNVFIGESLPPCPNEIYTIILLSFQMLRGFSRITRAHASVNSTVL